MHVLISLATIRRIRSICLCVFACIYIYIYILIYTGWFEVHGLTSNFVPKGKIPWLSVCVCVCACFFLSSSLYVCLCMKICKHVTYVPIIVCTTHIICGGENRYMQTNTHIIPTYAHHTYTAEPLAAKAPQQSSWASSWSREWLALFSSATSSPRTSQRLWLSAVALLFSQLMTSHPRGQLGTVSIYYFVECYRATMCVCIYVHTYVYMYNREQRVLMMISAFAPR